MRNRGCAEGAGRLNSLSDTADAETLRGAAEVLHARAKKHTFMLRVIIRVLQRTADHIERELDRDEGWE